MARRAGLFVLLLAFVAALAAPSASASATAGDDCSARTACVSAGGEHDRACLTDARCGGAAAAGAAAGAAVLLAVVVAAPIVPGLVRARHDLPSHRALTPLLFVLQLLRPPQPVLPS